MFKSIGLGFTAKVVSLGSNIILIPLILTSLSQSSFTLWMLFTSLYSLVTIFDFGFSATISRYISYGFNGLTIDDFKINNFRAKTNRVNKDFISVISFSNNKIFTFLISLSALVLVIIYYYYVYLIKLDIDDVEKFSFAIFLVSIMITLSSVKSNGVLHGSGNISKIYLNTIFSNVIFLFIAVITIYLEYGIFGLCLARLLSSISQFFINHSAEKKILNKYRVSYKKEQTDITKKIAKNAVKLGVGGVGNYLSNRTILMVLASIFSLSSLSGVSFFINVSIIIVSSTLIILNNSTPTFVKLRTNGKCYQLKSLFIKVLSSSLLLYSILYWLFFISAYFFIGYFNSKTELPNIDVVILLFIVFLIEILISVSVIYLSTGDNVIFSKHQLLSGMLFLSICFFLYCIDVISVEIVLVSQIISQSIYNLWRWPLECFYELKLKD